MVTGLYYDGYVERKCTNLNINRKIDNSVAQVIDNDQGKNLSQGPTRHFACIYFDKLQLTHVNSIDNIKYHNL